MSEVLTVKHRITRQRQRPVLTRFAASHPCLQHLSRSHGCPLHPHGCICSPNRHTLTDPSTPTFHHVISVTSPLTHHVANHRLVRQRQRPTSPRSTSSHPRLQHLPRSHGSPHMPTLRLLRCAPTLPHLTGPCSRASPSHGSLLPTS